MYTQLLYSFTAPFSLLSSSFSYYSYIINILFIFAGGVGWYEARFLNEPFFGAHYKVDVLPTQMYFCNHLNRTDRRSATRVWPGLTTENGIASCGFLNVHHEAGSSYSSIKLNKHIKTWSQWDWTLSWFRPMLFCWSLNGIFFILFLWPCNFFAWASREKST